MLGLGKSGMATAAFFQNQGVKVSGWDDCEAVRKIASDHGLPIIDFPYPNKMLYSVVSPGISFARLETFHRKRLSDVGIVTCDLGLFLKLFPTSKVLGVTGTNGKSTTCSIIAHALRAQGIFCQLVGNIGVPIFSVAQHHHKNPWYLLEWSSYQLELCAHHPWELEVGGILNLSAHHLERHGTMEHYSAIKCKILEHSRHAILDISSDYTQKIAHHWKGNPLIYLKALEENCSQKEDPSCVCYNSQGIWWKEEFEKFPKEDRFLSFAFQQNVAMAYSVLHHIPGGLEKFIPNVQKFQDLAHRQECFLVHDGTYCVDDSKATTPEACVQALMRWSCPVFWIAGGAKQKDDLSVLKPVLSKITQAFVYGESALRFQKFLNANSICCENFITMKDAVYSAWSQARLYKKAVILCSPGCPSFDQFPNFVQRGKAFQENIHQLVYAHSAKQGDQFLDTKE
ncbi:UDP-N-acetylmuramoylalanine--D-glutamate ligase [Holospora elegans E1]|uniref:UDP-N-acetylmuramoylalanine--D-glutamate ligase n=1 Tax=Holospora elegans E1 TaxID=1427503 RepID=A0A023DWJ7_9PROT|nr:UDP-N-acetylmuramoyl-L-alanine--D-glutamate ligase [Holospora elegans]GAJ45798.1 UDP-N-acetylmuramoylalanine--D-glutamate ligase [Holospora elegans E1]